MTAEQLLRSAITEGVFPGCAYAFGDLTRHQHGYLGHQTYCPESRAIGADSLWDLASVSKVVATTTASMILHDEGKLNLDMPVADLLPAFAQGNKGSITVRNLLVHDSGLIAFRPYHSKFTNPDDVWQAVCQEKLTYPTGSKSVYSDLSMIALSKLIETVSGLTLDKFVKQRVFRPLEMTSTQYSPGIDNLLAVPTEPVEPWRETLRKLRHPGKTFKPSPDGTHWIQGEVHDPTATVLGGVAGHAGLFSNLDDLVKFAHFLLRDGKPLVQQNTFRLFTLRQEEKSTRGLGWDTKSPEGSSAGTKFGAKSFGHTGFTGTCLWVDPERKFFAILLGNRVHPTANNLKIAQLRPKFHDLIWSEAF